MQSKSSIPVTRQGLEKIKVELHRLKTKERPKVIEAIAVARAHGDLSENAEYDAAKEKQAQVERSIAELEESVNRANIIEVSSNEEIVFGAYVKVQEVGFSEIEEYHLVGASESNPSEGKISTSSPLGKALLKKKRGETVAVATPNGTINMKIIDFWYE